jgi:inosine-uridine nucleoside N-ribohydrolase
MLDGFGLNGIPLGYGQDAPLAGGNPFPEWMRRDANEFWSIQLPHRGATYPAQPAAELMVSILNAATEPVTVFVSGPCTDLALALEMDPGIRDHIQAVYIMGGAVNVPGNIDDLIPNHPNKTAEWNIYGDPLSAKQVFESGLEIYLIPLDATNQVRVNTSDTSAWRGGGQIGDTAAEFYDMMLAKNHMSGFAIWDVMTAEVMVQPDLCEFEPMPLEVITGEVPNEGQTLRLADGEPNVYVCLRPQVAQIKALLIDTFSIAP